MNQTASIRIIAENVQFEHFQKELISKTFFSITDYYKKYPNPGACHLISSIMHVLLEEQGIKHELCIGEVKTGMKYFDHSWIEIDGKVFDIAIQNTLDGNSNGPVFFGIDLITEKKPSRFYGESSPTGFDKDAKMVLNTDFSVYLSGYPQFREGAWKIVKDIGKELNLKLEINTLKEKYKNTKRIIKA